MPQHCEMIEAYVDCELAAMKEIFPTLSSRDGLCLILGGMADVKQYDSTTFTTVISYYGLSSDEILNTNNDYKSSTSGQSCNLN
jgi:hypothetical protein